MDNRDIRRDAEYSRVIWRTKSGEKIEVCNLGDSHLLNIKNMLERNGWVHTETAMACLSYAFSAPEGAANAAEAEFYSMKFSNVSDAIFEECDMRGLG